MSDHSRSGLNVMAKEALKAVVTLREQHGMNLGGIEILHSSINKILGAFVEALQERIANVDPESAAVFKQAAREYILNEPLKQISSEHRVMSCLKLYCGFIEPVPVKQGIDFRPTYGDKNESLGAFDMNAVIIPIEKQLEMLLQYEEIRSLILNSGGRKSEDDVIRSAYDGSLVQTHPLYQRYKNGFFLLLQLYEDDIEICNPLGSYTKTHKVCMIYWSLLNFPEHIRSSMKCINLLGVATSNSIKNYGFEAVLADLFDFIKRLESPEGVQMKIDAFGGNVTLHGTLVSVNGDGLAMNSLGGFKGIGFSYKPCRNCDLSRDEMGKIFYETRLRDFVTHRERVNKILDENRTKDEKAELSKQFGINGRSVLEDLKHFDLTKALPQDAMHNLLEGVAEVELRALIFELVEQKRLLTYDHLNHLLAGFPYSKDFMRSKPSPIEPAHIKNGKLRQNASQMICLIYSVPLMLAEFVKDESAIPFLENFSLLGKITNIILAYEVKRSDLSLCRLMINCHHTRYKELYPNFPPTPKFHFLVHTPSVIELLGPVRISWCMRYEAMNSLASKFGEQTKNFINIPRTIAVRFQTKRCLDFHFGDKNAVVFGEKTFMAEGEQEFDIDTYILGFEVSAELQLHPSTSSAKTEIHAAQKVNIKNFELNLDSILMIAEDEQTLPKFGKVKALFVKAKECAIVLQQFKTEGYNNMTNAYEVTLTTRFCCMNHRKIAFLHPLPLVELRGKTSIILQYHTRNEFQG